MILTKEDIIKRAPSVYAEQPKEGLSKHYRFIPTSQVIDVLSDNGWLPVKVQEQSTRKEENQGFQKHIIHFQKEDVSLKVGDTTFRLLVTNSHNGMSSFQFMAGLYRLVCSNGLVVNNGTASNYRVLHKGYSDNNVIDVVGEIVKDVPMIADNVRKMQEIVLSDAEKDIFARSALKLKWDDDTVIDYGKFLQPRRREDALPSLWNTYNVIQENLTKGGFYIQKKDIETQKLEYKKVRKIKSINEDLKLNKALWSLTEEMLKLKGVN